MRTLPLLLLLAGCPGPEAPDLGGAADLAATDAAAADLAAPPDLRVQNPIEGVAAAEKVVGGFLFTEGPLWLADRGVLLFSDIQGDRIVELTPPMAVRTFRMPSGNSNGLARDPMGRLLACEHGNRRLSRTAADGNITAVAERWEGKRLSSPNDAIVRSDGTIYFTDPPYGVPMGQSQELAFQGVFRVDPAGTLHLVDQTLNRPNGVALSPDEKTLYVADTAQGQVFRYAVNTDGTVGPRQPFAVTGGGGDGVAIDDAGNVYVAANAGVRAFRPDGTAWGTVTVAEVPANVGFGDGDRRTLYITARTSLYRARLLVPGIP